MARKHQFHDQMLAASYQHGIPQPVPELWAIVRSATSLADSDAVQSIFASANDALTVAGGTTYFFEMRLRLATGTDAHDVELLFSGTATLTTIHYMAQSVTWAEGAAGTAATATVIATAVTDATYNAHITGYISVNAGGTLIPQISFSAAPGGTNAVDVGTFIRLTPVGTDVAAASGGWS